MLVMFNPHDMGILMYQEGGHGMERRFSQGSNDSESLVPYYAFYFILGCPAGTW